MNAMEIIEEYRNRSRTARTYREVAALLLIVSVVLLALYAVNRAGIGIWGGLLLAAGVVVLVVCFALAMLSFLQMRCPNCGRILGEVHQAAFCPACGVALTTDDFGLETASAPKRGPGSGGRSISVPKAARRAVGRGWEPRSGTPGIDDYPQEAYPKNIRMFTTSDEMELTKRYIHLIDRDNSSQPGVEALPGKKSKYAPAILPQQASGASGDAAGIRTRRGIFGSISLESIIAIVAGGIILGAVLILVITAIR